MHHMNYITLALCDEMSLTNNFYRKIKSLFKGLLTSYEKRLCFSRHSYFLIHTTSLAKYHMNINKCIFLRKIQSKGIILILFHTLYQAFCLYHSINLQSQTILFQGCYHIVVSFIYENLTKIGIGILVSASVHILGLVLTCLLAKNVKRAEYEEIR